MTKEIVWALRPALTREVARSAHDEREVSALGYELSFATRSFDAAGSPALVIGLGLVFDRGL